MKISRKIFSLFQIDSACGYVPGCDDANSHYAAVSMENDEKCFEEFGEIGGFCTKKNVITDCAQTLARVLKFL